MKSRDMFYTVAITMLMAGVGCSVEKTTMKMQDPMTPNLTTTVPEPKPIKLEGIFASHESLEPIYFELNKSKLNDKSMDVMKKNMEWLKTQPPFLIRVIGYADGRGSASKNERLAKRRALEVRQAYVNGGIPVERISVVFKTPELSECTSLTEECLSENRKVETFIESKALVKK